MVEKGQSAFKGLRDVLMPKNRAVCGKTLSVLVFPGGTEIGLEIQRALRCTKKVRLFSAGQDVSNHADCVFRRHSVIPSVHQSSWLEALNALILRNKIDYIFPAHDEVLMALAEENHRLPSRIVTSPPETCLVTCFKSLTYDALANVIPVPKLYQGWQDVDEFPVFAKPDRGQGSQRARAVFSRSQLASLLEEESDLIVCEYLPGEEYTVDCFSDREAGLLFCGGRTRKRTKSGISMNSLPVNDEAFRQYALSISNKLDLHGAWFFQLKRDREGVLRLLEVAPRIAGTMALHRVLGLNFPLLSIYEQERIPVEIMLNDCVVEVDRALVNRYRHNFRFRSVYVDFDDTLVFNEGVNTEVVRFLFQCINQGKRVVLLTRHEGDLQEVLSRYRLTGIFDEIIKVGPESSKADYIADREAILIDDSFSERKEVFNRTGIFSFDCSMLEILLDERL